MTKVNFTQRPDHTPRIYVYELPNSPDHNGQVKIGYTTRDVKTRIHEQLGTSNQKYKIRLDEPAVKNDGSTFTDTDVHRILENGGLTRIKNEWFACKVGVVKKAISAIRNGKTTITDRTLDFPMRPEQQQAVDKTVSYFKSIADEGKGDTPHFLWNAKMRFGKTFTSYQLALKMGWTKILVLTFKPAVQNAWQEDLNQHVNFDGWQFISKKTTDDISTVNMDKPLVCFGSFQDYLGRDRRTKAIKPENQWVHDTQWDCVIFDEYHFGAWREGAKDLFADEGARELKSALGDGLGYFDDNNMKINIPITTNHYLYLSGTPFRAIAEGEFIEEQIYNWTYSDEQNEKETWDNKKGDNPYAPLPKMVMMTYQLPEHITDIARGGEFNEFDLNAFFTADDESWGNIKGADGKLKKGANPDITKAQFKHKDEVQKWLDIIRGNDKGAIVKQLKVKKPLMPFDNTSLLNILSHTFWFLPNVAACHAMNNLLNERQNTFYHDYEIIVCAGTDAGIGVEALKPVKKAMENPLETKTITLSCGKLTTGVSVKPWSGILMLRNLTSPETYFQSAFRVQTPWTIPNPDGKNPNATAIMKEECYVFDFAPNRALRLLSDYACQLQVDSISPEKKVQDFINFLPILAYDGNNTAEVDAKAVLDMAMSGTTATLLAKRWNSPLLVNVDNMTLSKLLANDDAMEALAKIEDFRTIKEDVNIIIARAEEIKDLKGKKNEKDLNKKEKKKLSEAEKEYKSKRKMIQDKLRKLSSRIPVFMYLTDEREETLQDVIKQLETELFKKVTGLTIREFETLESIGVFNGNEMNSAVYKFRRYEDSSIGYVGDNKTTSDRIALYNTIINKNDVIE